MKKSILLLTLIAIGLASMAQTEVKSQIEKVTIYPTSALVEKYVTVNLKRGENMFVIHSNALRISTSDIHFASSPDWFICSLNTQKVSATESDFLSSELSATALTQYQQLKQQYADVNLKRSNTEVLIATLKQQAEALKKMKAVNNTVAFDTLVNFNAQLEFQRKESQAINSSLIKAKKELNDLSEKQKKIEDDLARVLRQQVGSSTPTLDGTDIYVTIYSNKALNNARIAYSYRTQNVNCHYSYDVMLYEESRQAVFSLKATVEQNSGEHWKGCQLAFSTTDAGYAGFDSQLSTYYLSAYRPVQRTRVAAAKTMALERNMVTIESDAEVANEAGFFSSPATSQNLTLSREYLLHTQQPILTHENAQTLLLQRDTTSVVFARFATPKNEEKVHFTALLPDWESLGLLDVDCNVYMNNRFVSTSEVVTAGSGDTLRFAVGQDPNVHVSRKYAISTPDKGLLSKEVTQTVTVTLTVKNTKSEPIEIRLKDQVPISSQSEIKVLDINPGGGTLNEKTGIIRWILPVKALEQKTITFSYSVKYPKEMEGSIILR